VPGFFVFSLEGRYRAAHRDGVALRVDNLFDRTYSNYGQLSVTRFRPGRSYNSNPATWPAEQFRSCGAAWNLADPQFCNGPGTLRVAC